LANGGICIVDPFCRTLFLYCENGEHVKRAIDDFFSVMKGTKRNCAEIIV